MTFYLLLITRLISSKRPTTYCTATLRAFRKITYTISSFERTESNRMEQNGIPRAFRTGMDGKNEWLRGELGGRGWDFGKRVDKKSDDEGR